MFHLPPSHVEQHSETEEILKYFWNSYKKFHIDIVACAFVFWFPDKERTQGEISVSINGIHAESNLNFPPPPFLEITQSENANNIRSPTLDNCN